jgi:hypothetical protein
MWRGRLSTDSPSVLYFHVGMFGKQRLLSLCRKMPEIRNTFQFGRSMRRTYVAAFGAVV